MLIDKMKISNSTLLMNAFRYPCVKVINKLLELDIDINRKFWIINESGHMHITPLMSAIVCMLDTRHMNASEKIILLLLQKGADTEMPIFITEEDWNSEEEYNQRCQPIYKVCDWFLANRIEKFNDIDNREIVKKTMEMIINHRQEKKMSHSKTL